MFKNLLFRISTIVFISIFSLISCKKAADIVPAPTVSFSSSDKGNGLYQFNITSTNATSYMWQFGDDEFSDDASPLHTYTSNGAYTVKVTAKGEGGSTSSTKTINVTSCLGSVTFWTKTGDYIIDVTLGGKTGGITSNYTSTPDCAASGTVSFSNLSEGKYTFTAKERRTSPRTWSGTVSIIGGICSKMQLTYQ